MAFARRRWLQRAAGRVAPIGRRSLLAMAGGLAAAAISTPRRAGAQTLTATSISQAAQDARRDVGRLSPPRRQSAAPDRCRRARARRRRGAPVPRRAGRAGARSADGLQQPRQRGRLAAGDAVRELDLALAMRPLVIRMAPTSDEVEAAIKQPLPQIEPLAGDNAEDVLLTIVLSTLGLTAPCRAVRATAQRPRARPRRPRHGRRR